MIDRTFISRRAKQRLLENKQLLQLGDMIMGAHNPEFIYNYSKQVRLQHYRRQKILGRKQECQVYKYD